MQPTLLENENLKDLMETKNLNITKKDGKKSELRKN